MNYFKEEHTGSAREKQPVYWQLIAPAPFQYDDFVYIVMFSHGPSIKTCIPDFAERISANDFIEWICQKDRDAEELYKYLGCSRKFKSFYRYKKFVDILMCILVKSKCGKMIDNKFHSFFANQNVFDLKKIYIENIYKYFKAGAISDSELAETDFYKTSTPFTSNKLADIQKPELPIDLCTKVYQTMDDDLFNHIMQYLTFND